MFALLSLRLSPAPSRLTAHPPILVERLTFVCPRHGFPSLFSNVQRVRLRVLPPFALRVGTTHHRDGLLQDLPSFPRRCIRHRIGLAYFYIIMRFTETLNSFTCINQHTEDVCLLHPQPVLLNLSFDKISGYDYDLISLTGIITAYLIHCYTVHWVPGHFRR